MMEYVQVVLICLSAGLVYGCSFVLQQRSIFSPTHGITNHMKPIAFFLVRILALCCTGYYLLRTPTFLSILGSITFFVMFWLVLLVVRAQSYERV